jgi:hypothetical protein
LEDSRFRQSISPLRPLQHRLRLLRAVGFPLRILNEDATEFGKRNSFLAIFVATTILPLAAPISYTIAIIILHGPENYLRTVFKLWEDSGLDKFDLKGWMFQYVPFCVMPFIYFKCYRGTACQLSLFSQEYIRNMKGIVSQGMPYQSNS